MKGEEVPESARWGGNPAVETRDVPYQPAALAYEARRGRLGRHAQSAEQDGRPAELPSKQ
jgi:hypothetical protein